MGMYSPQIATKKMVPLCRQLATAYGGGIPIIQAMEGVAERSKDKKIREVFTLITEDIRKGETLSGAVQNQSRYLSPSFVQLLAIGEEGGRLDITLKDLAQYYEDRQRMQRKIQGMMIYPMIQLTAAWFLGTFALGMLGIVGDAVAGTGGGTGGVMEYIGSWLRFQAIAMIILAVILALSVVLGRMGTLGWFTGLFSTHIWPMAPITRKFALARFFRNFALQLAAGVPIVRCIQQAALVTANPYIERDLLKVVPYVKEGTTLTEAFTCTRFLTPMAHEMLHIGEESGSLDQQLTKVSEYYLSEAEHALKVAVTILGIAILVTIAILVGYIIITFYMGLYGEMLNDLGV